MTSKTLQIGKTTMCAVGGTCVLNYKKIGYYIKKHLVILFSSIVLVEFNFDILSASQKIPSPKTPIHYVIILFQENVSFDHYFGTYPNALNLSSERVFHPRPGTPLINGLTSDLRKGKENRIPPFHLTPSNAVTCDQLHFYLNEQLAYFTGQFVQFTGSNAGGCDPKTVMGYFDGNTVTALWNYAQYFAMSDNHFATVFGPSTPGALNLISGQTHGADVEDLIVGTGPEVIHGTVIGDPQPRYDDCSSRDVIGMKEENKNIGNLLNEKGVSWGFFQGGFRPSVKSPCPSEYIPHHEPFQYYKSTANPHHVSPASVKMIGRSEDRANHQYDLENFWNAAENGVLPQVSFLKAPASQDGHAAYSNPLDEQVYLVSTLNRLQLLPEWKEMLVIIAYDDSDGWYDHARPPMMNPSQTVFDGLTGFMTCGKSDNTHYQGRCGYGPRLPLLVISPYSKENYIDHTVTDQTSILRFIEDNWNLGRIGDQSFDEKANSVENMLDFLRKPRNFKLFLNPNTGEIVRSR